MDWSRAQSWLIAAFVILNLYLWLQLQALSGGPVPQALYLSAPTPEGIADQLDRFDVSLSIAPGLPSTLPPLSAEPITANIRPERFFDAPVEGSQTSVAGETGLLYGSAGGRLFISQAGRVIYRDDNALSDSRGLPDDVTGVHREAEAFIRRHEAFLSDMREQQLVPRRDLGAMEITYRQVVPNPSVGELPLLNGRVTVVVGRNGVISYEQHLWDVLAPAGEDRALLPPTTLLDQDLEEGGALLALLEEPTDGRRREQPPAVLAVELAYLVGPPPAAQTADGVDGAAPYRATPVYVITLDGRRLALFNAYSGRLIADPVP